NLLDEGTCVDLAALDADALVSLLDWAGERAERPRANQLLELSGGNPLLALEVLNNRGAPPAVGAAAAPGRVNRFLSSRLATFSREDELVLAAGALLGPSVDDDLVASTAVVTPATAAAVRKRGVDAGLLRRSDDGFAFSHGLLRDTLLDSIPRAELIL